MNRSALSAALLLLAMVLMACSSDAASPSATESEAEATEEASVEPAEEASEPPAATDDGLEEGAGDLDAILPDEVGGIAMEYQSSQGEEVMGSEGMTPETIALFERLGANPSDLSSAFGFGFDQENGSAITIFAFRVAGANQDQLRDEFIATMEEEAEAGSTFTETTVGGKSVLEIGADGETSGGYLYVKNDIVFLVGGSPPELVEEALTGLP